MQPFQTQFVLTREYLSESYDQSLPHSKAASPNFVFPIVTLAIGVGLLMWTDQQKIIGIAFVSFSVLEFLHIRYRRAWWLMRQLWGRSGGSEVSLSINENEIVTENGFTETRITFGEIERVIETELGMILVTNTGQQQYLSKSIFPDDLVQELLALNDSYNQ